ncbi:LLM class flavin-dependent oxidoreductase [Novosphingobium sp. G106]|uniref:LLM class flavin-dependent oxidoreductase n=1 Tax=Novosphingobium sp. G106 TaxID=2849500 RepID=UPI001C2DAFA1|nr:LLM class flavin-dependent oxidoreductase [Novosphingobium sp. G106]MBV1691121.1 LLM class flavin-dependent oxidoreductase [Novosphingobium sp. G106]
MKVNLGLSSQSADDWDRVLAGDFSRPPAIADWRWVEAMMAMGDLAEPLGFDGIWAPEHFGSPYGMVPNPLQLLTYSAGRTGAISLGTFVIVAPWWHPVRLAHQIAYLDILSNGRLTTIGLGRGVAKKEFDALGVPREQARQRFNETLDILTLAFSTPRFAYDGEIFQVPEMSLRPAPKSADLHKRFFGSAATRDSLEILTRKGLVPLFVGNKPIEQAGEDVRLVNTIRAELGLAPCQPKNTLFMYCALSEADAERSQEWVVRANMDVNLHYGFADASNFKGIAGYEAYAEREAAATALLSEAVTGKVEGKVSALPGYHASNLMIGTPDTVYAKIKAAQEACSFQEITLVTHFGNMPHEDAMKSTRLFAAEVLPALHRMEAPLHAAALPLA